MNCTVDGSVTAVADDTEELDSATLNAHGGCDRVLVVTARLRCACKKFPRLLSYFNWEQIFVID